MQFPWIVDGAVQSPFAFAFLKAVAVYFSFFFVEAERQREIHDWQILLEQAGRRYDRKPVAALINYLDNRDGTGKWNHFREHPTVAAE